MNTTPWPDVAMSEEDGVRYLHLDSPWVQGAMRVARPLDLELDYVQRMMAWLLWVPTESLAQGHAVQLGLGAGALTRFCHQRMGWRSTAVEFNPGVIRACRHWFELPLRSKGLKVVCADAGDWVQQPQHAGTANALQVDLYDHEAAAPVLDSVEFYAHCREVLAPQGLMTVNLFGRRSSFERTAQRLQGVFGRSQVWKVRPTREGNTVVVASKGVVVPEAAVITARARWVQQHWGLPALRWRSMVSPL